MAVEADMATGQKYCWKPSTEPSRWWKTLVAPTALKSMAERVRPKHCRTRKTGSIERKLSRKARTKLLFGNLEIRERRMVLNEGQPLR
jgi:hypothetical protein